MADGKPRDPPPDAVVNNCVLPRTLRDNVDEDGWARVDGRTVTLGWTDSSQTVTGSILSVNYQREPGVRLETGDPIATVEAAKWMGVVRAPFAGDLTAINEAIEGRHGVVHPVNRSPYHEGWIAEIELRGDPEDQLEGFVPIAEAVEAYEEKIDRLDLDACVHCDSFEI